MMNRRRFLVAGLAAAASFTLGGCPHLETVPGRPDHRREASRGPGRGYGPPPHAPAHGYRRKHRRSGVDMVYDSGLGVYVVVGLPIYFRDELFYRLGRSGWEFSANVRGPWHAASDRAVPPRLLAAKGHGRGNVKHRARGRGKGKGRHRD